MGGADNGRRAVMRPVLIAAGVLAMGYSVVGALTGPSFHPVGQVAFLAAVLLAHDAVIAPVVIGVGFLVGRWVPNWLRPIVYGALAASAAVTLFALPFVLGRGKRADIASALPLHYTRGWLMSLAAIWLVAALLAWGRRRVRRMAKPDSRRRPA
jgi:hypothetical protein